MTHYRLIPSADPDAFIDYEGFDPSSSLNIASVRHIEEADLYQDEKYLFSLRMNGAQGGCWIIHRRPELTKPDLTVQ